MAQATPFNLSEKERALLAETERSYLATLDEDELLAVHRRVRKARNKHVDLYRREAAKAVKAKGGRGKATQAPRRLESKAELFEDGLARVSRALGAAAGASARRLKEERLAAARAASAAPTAAADSEAANEPPAPKTRTAARERPPIEKKAASHHRASGKRTQAKRDSR